LKRIKEHPHEIISHEYHDTSTLHLACSYQAPLEIISAMVALHPELILVQEASFHYTPLHIVSHCYGLGFRAQSQRGSIYEVEVMNCLLKACPDAVRIKTTRTGWIPLHVICGQDDIPLSIMKLLVDVDPNTLHLENTGGVTPMQILCSSFLMKLMDDSDGVIYSALGDDEGEGKFSSLESMKPQQIILLLKFKGIDPENLSSIPLWDKIQYATRKLFAHNFLKTPHSFAPILHSIAGTKILRDIVSLSLSLYSSQLKFYCQEGFLPLHVAILTNGCKCGEKLKESKHQCKCFTRLNPIDLIVLANPETVRYPFKDKQHRGRLPLHVAIENKIQWSKGLKALFLAAPEFAHKKDVPSVTPNVSLENSLIYHGSGLYPFMFAATTMRREVKNNIDERRLTDPEELEVIYELLRAAPELLKNCTFNGAFQNLNIS